MADRSVSVKVDISQSGGSLAVPKPTLADSISGDQKAPEVNLKKSLSAIATSFEQSFTNLRNIGSSLQQIAASQAPTAVQTLTGSMQLLAGEVAGLLIPALAQTSLTIQNITRTIHGLDEQTKGAISHLGAVGGPLLGAAAGIGVLSTVLRPVIGLVTSALAAGPLGIAGLAVAGGVAAMATTDKGRDALASLAEALTPLVDAFATIIEAGLPVLVEVLAEIVKDWIAPLVKDLADLVKALVDDAGKVGTFLDADIGDLVAAMWKHGTIDPLNDEVIKELRSRAADDKDPGKPLAGSIMTGPGRSFTSGGDFYRDMLMQAIGADQLAQEQRRQRLENQFKMIEQLGQINANTRRTGGGSGPPDPRTADPTTRVVLDQWGVR